MSIPVPFPSLKNCLSISFDELIGWMGKKELWFDPGRPSPAARIRPPLPAAPRRSPLSSESDAASDVPSDVPLTYLCRVSNFRARPFVGGHLTSTESKSKAGRQRCGNRWR